MFFVLFFFALERVQMLSPQRDFPEQFINKTLSNRKTETLKKEKDYDF